MTVLCGYDCLTCAEFADAVADGNARGVLVPGGAYRRHDCRMCIIVVL